MKNKALCMPCLRYGMLLPQGRHQDKSIALIATYYKGWNNAGDRPYVREYELASPVAEGADLRAVAGAVVARKRNDGNGMNCLIVYEEIEREA